MSCDSGPSVRELLILRKNSRGEEIVEVVLRAPDVHDERTRELLRELGQVQKDDVRSDMWKRVQPAA